MQVQPLLLQACQKFLSPTTANRTDETHQIRQSFTTQQRLFRIKIQNKDTTERNGTKLSEMITSGTPFTLFPILITHSKNPPKRETNNKSALAPKQTLCLLLY